MQVLTCLHPNWINNSFKSAIRIFFFPPTLIPRSNAILLSIMLCIVLQFFLYFRLGSTLNIGVPLLKYKKINHWLTCVQFVLKAQITVSLLWVYCTRGRILEPLNYLIHQLLFQRNSFLGYF